MSRWIWLIRPDLWEAREREVGKHDGVEESAGQVGDLGKEEKKDIWAWGWRAVMILSVTSGREPVYLSDGNFMSASYDIRG